MQPSPRPIHPSRWMRALRTRRRFRQRLRRHPYPEQFAETQDLARYTGPPRPYLIATTPRSGSHFLGHAIASVGHFGFPLEYLNPGNLRVWSDRFGTDGNAETLAAIAHRRSGPTGLFGIKAHWDQWAGFDRHDVIDRWGGISRAIWIRRRDLAAQAISFTVAEQTGQWISGSRARGPAAYDAVAIARNARRIRRQNENWRAFFDGPFAGPVLKVVYEDLTARPEAAFEAVARFLDRDTPVRPRAPGRTKRQTTGHAPDWRARFAIEAGPEDSWILEPQPI